MSYAGVEYGDDHGHEHCGDSEPHGEHRVYLGGRRYNVCTGQVAARRGRAGPGTAGRSKARHGTSD